MMRRRRNPIFFGLPPLLWGVGLGASAFVLANRARIQRAAAARANILANRHRIAVHSANQPPKPHQSSWTNIITIAQSREAQGYLRELAQSSISFGTARGSNYEYGTRVASAWGQLKNSPASRVLYLRTLQHLLSFCPALYSTKPDGSDGRWDPARSCSMSEAVTWNYNAIAA